MSGQPVSGPPPAILFFQVLEQVRPVLQGHLPPGRIHVIRVRIDSRQGDLEAGRAAVSTVPISDLDVLNPLVERLRRLHLIPALVQIGETSFLCSVDAKEALYSIHVQGPLLLAAGKDPS